MPALLPASSDISTTTAVVFKAEDPAPGLPVHLIISSINVSAVVEYVGVTAQGSVGVPKGPSNVAWFSIGPRPGEKGNAIIDGHFGWKNGIPAVFDNVFKLRPGDKISVQDDKGASFVFIVRELRRYGQNDNSSSVFNSRDDKAHLVLITCEGTWNAVKKSYSDRLVVFADII